MSCMIDLPPLSMDSKCWLDWRGIQHLIEILLELLINIFVRLDLDGYFVSDLSGLDHIGPWVIAMWFISGVDFFLFHFLVSVFHWTPAATVFMSGLGLRSTTRSIRALVIISILIVFPKTFLS